MSNEWSKMLKLCLQLGVYVVIYRVHFLQSLWIKKAPPFLGEAFVYRYCRFLYFHQYHTSPVLLRATAATTTWRIEREGVFHLVMTNINFNF
jgi:hypothetical protein